jgi:hypothetical protein
MYLTYFSLIRQDICYDGKYQVSIITNHLKKGIIMIQCKDCELCEITQDGKRVFKCDPFTNIKEPECVQKWQLLRLDMLVANYQTMMRWYQKISPLQEKMFKYMKRELDDIEETDSWKYEEDEDDTDQPLL